MTDFIDKDARAQRGQVIYSMSHSIFVPELGLSPRPPESLSGLYCQTSDLPIPWGLQEGWKAALRGPLICLENSAKQNQAYLCLQHEPRVSDHNPSPFQTTPKRGFSPQEGSLFHCKSCFPPSPPPPPQVSKETLVT